MEHKSGECNTTAFLDPDWSKSNEIYEMISNYGNLNALCYSNLTKQGEGMINYVDAYYDKNGYISG